MLQHSMFVIKDQSSSLCSTLVCNQCQTFIRKCDSTKNCTLHCKQGGELLLNDQLIVTNVYCTNCLNELGYKIVNLVSKSPQLVPYPTEQTHSCVGVANYVNELIDLENNLTKKIQKLQHSNLLSRNSQLIGSYCLKHARISHVVRNCC